MIRVAPPIALACLIVVPSLTSAQLTPPSVRLARPFGAAPGETLRLEVRGTNLDGASALWFQDPRVKVEGLELAKPEDKDARFGRKLTALVSLPADLPVGPLTFRVVTPQGVSNPGQLRLGRALPSRTESEPNNSLRKPEAVAMPAAIEGMIEPGNDVDVFAVEAKAGETLIVEAIAARAGAGLDALVTIFSPDGRELASEDDTFGRDAAVVATVPVSGRYLVQIQDANGRRNDAMVEQAITREYRLEIGRLPLVTTVFPAGARRGGRSELRLSGANLPAGGVFRFEPPADTPIGDTPLPVRSPLGAVNLVTVRVGEAPEVIEAEPNDEPAAAAVVTVPAAINGTLAATRQGDLDLFRLKAEPGHEGDYRITAYAAEVGSPADPVLMVLDARGDSQGEDDDKLGRDARLERAIDSKEEIVLAIRDYYGRGGPSFVYRIEVEPMGHRVELSADLGGRTLPRQGSLPIAIAVERRGYEGPLTILTGAMPPGVTAAPITLPSRARSGFLVLSAAAEAPLGVFPIRLTTRDIPVAAVVDYRERWGKRDALVEPRNAVLAVAERNPLGLALGPGPIEVPPGGQAEVKITLDRRTDAARKALKLRLLVPEGGLDGFEPVKELSLAADVGAASITLKARPDAAPRRIPIAARAWSDDAEYLGVATAPVELVVPGPVR